MRVAALHPIWDRSCEVCETYLFNSDGRPTLRGGLPVLRPEGAPTPCHKCEKVPLAVRASGADWKACRAAAADPTAANRQTLRFYRECKAVGEFPRGDALVRWYAVIIREAEDSVAREETARLALAIERLTLKLGQGR